jgi:integrase
MSETVLDVANLWLRRCELEGLERATLRSYRQHVRIYIGPKLGHIPVAQLTMPMVRALIDDMLATATKPMAKKVLGTCRSILNEGQARGLVSANVAREVRLRNSRRHEAEKVIPTKAEIRLLIEKAPERYRPVLLTAIFAGLRSSEIRGLKWSNVDFDRGIIRVRQRADRWGVLSSPKSRAGRRDIAMAPTVATVLREWKLRCPKGELDLVFPNGIGNVESHSNLYNRFYRPLMIECGIVGEDGTPRFSIHALRHATASLFIEQGWSPKKIQTLMGHSTIQMTFDVYGHLFDDTSGDLERMAKVERDLLAA